jgi:hypothetical protein
MTDKNMNMNTLIWFKWIKFAIWFPVLGAILSTSVELVATWLTFNELDISSDMKKVIIDRAINTEYVLVLGTISLIVTWILATDKDSGWKYRVSQFFGSKKVIAISGVLLAGLALLDRSFGFESLIFRLLGIVVLAIFAGYFYYFFCRSANKSSLSESDYHTVRLISMLMAVFGLISLLILTPILRMKPEFESRQFAMLLMIALLLGAFVSNKLSHTRSWQIKNFEEYLVGISRSSFAVFLIIHYEIWLKPFFTMFYLKDACDLSEKYLRIKDSCDPEMLTINVIIFVVLFTISLISVPKLLKKLLRNVSTFSRNQNYFFLSKDMNKMSVLIALISYLWFWLCYQVSLSSSLIFVDIYELQEVLNTNLVWNLALSLIASIVVSMLIFHALKRKINRI